jgi:hypothetical protein
MKNYFIKFTFSILMIILFSIVYFNIRNSNDCWVCEGDGENNCIVCVDGKTEIGECAFCDDKKIVMCTFCTGTGNIK